MLKRIVIAVVVVVFGVFLVLVASLLTIPCCALKPEVRLELATRQANGTTLIRLSTTIDDLQELQLFDRQGNLVETIPTAFEKEVNTSYWETFIPAHIQRIMLVTSSMRTDVAVEETAPDWRALDDTGAIGFEHVLGVVLFSVDAKESGKEVVRFTTSDNVFDTLHLYDAQNNQLNSIETAFTWDASRNWFVWEVTVPPEVAQMILHPRMPLEMTVEVQDLASGWLDSYEGIGFVRGELPMISLVSATARDDGQIEMIFEASELVLESMQLVRNDGTIESTIAVDFVPNPLRLGPWGFVWKVVIPSDAYKLVFVPVSSHQRGVHATSIVATWNEITLGEEIGFIQQP